MTKSELPIEKQTSPGLYLTAAEAYERWKANPEKVKVIDVRTVEEYLFIGHATMAWNNPVFFQNYVWDTNKHQFPMTPNPDFVTGIKKIANPSDMLLVMCRSGGRSALAVNQLAAAGFKTVYNIVDGMEGDSVEDPESVFFGQRMKNGWKNSGCPWTYKVEPEKMLIKDKP